MPAAATREGERRHVTVMFADVSGFTALARAMDPEDVTDLMNACFGILGRTVSEFGGHVDKYIGDCVMALFGAPTAIEDAPRQSINAAIRIIERIGEFAARRGISDQLDAHVGINTGLVVYSDVGGDDLRDTTAMGDTVNVASRLRDAAAAGAIYVGPQTHSETARDFEFRPVTGLRLKGIEGAYSAWEVRSRSPRLHRSGPAAVGIGGLSALVGRDQELATLDAALTALAAGRGGIVTITGEAGIGKTRLIRELRHRPAAAGLLFAEGCALRVGSSLAMYPFASLLRSWAGISGNDPPLQARTRMIAALESELHERTPEVYPFVATLAGLALLPDDSRRIEGIDAEGMQRLVTHRLLELFGAISRQRPLVLVLEDLHWADGSSIELLLRLLALAHESPLLFVLAYRADGGPGSSGLAREIRERHADVAVDVPLHALDPKAAGAMLRERIRFDDRPDQTRRTILDRASGNPFFIEEMIRSLIDVGAIHNTAEGLEVTGRIESVRVPGTVQELVMDRVDRLEPDVREVLQSASVVGRTFSRELLEAIVDEPAKVAPALAQLLDLELLERAAGDDRSFSFRHALAHDTVYESILRRRRRELHRRVATSIEALHRERIADHLGALAFHFSNAEDWEKASHYLVRAGDEAARATASDEALRCFTEAARIQEEHRGGDADPAGRAAIEKKIGVACLNKGDLPGALDRFDRALELLGHSVPRTKAQIAWRIASDLGAILSHLYLRGGAMPHRKPPATVIEVAELCFHKGKAQSTTAPHGYVVSMLPAIRSVGAWDFRGIEHACGVYSAGAALFAWSGLSFRIARRMSDTAEALVRTVPDSVIHATMRFVARYLEGDWSDAIVLPRELVENGLRYGAFWEVNTYLGMLCERQLHQGRFDAAAETLGHIAAIGQRYGYDFARTNEHAMRAFLLLQARRIDDAAAAAERYYEVCHEEALDLLALSTRARVHLLAGRRDDALAAIREAEALAMLIGRQAAAYHLSPLRVARLACDVEELEDAALRRDSAAFASTARRARTSRRKALAIVRAIARDRPECFRLCARLEWAAGRHRSALRWWTRALVEAERRRALPEVARTCREAAARLERGPRHGRVGGLDAAALAARAVVVEQELDREWSRARERLVAGRGAPD